MGADERGTKDGIRYRVLIKLLFLSLFYSWSGNFLIRSSESCVPLFASVNKTSCSRGTVCVSPSAVTVRHPSEEISIFGRFLATKWKQVVEGWGGNPVPLLLWIARMLLHTINHNKRRLLCFCAVRKLINAKEFYKGFAYVPLSCLYQLFGVAAAPVLKRQHTGWSLGCTCRSNTALPWALTGLWPDSLLNWKISLQTERFVQPEGRRQNIRSATSYSSDQAKPGN